MHGAGFHEISLWSSYSDFPLIGSINLDEHKHNGFVDFGVDLDDDSVMQVKDALVFMVF